MAGSLSASQFPGARALRAGRPAARFKRTSPPRATSQQGTTEKNTDEQAQRKSQNKGPDLPFANMPEFPDMPEMPEMPDSEEVGNALLDATGLPRKTAVPMPSWLDNPIFTLAAAAAFGLIAYDVNAPDSVHLLQPIDQGIHHWVGAHTSADFRKYVADLAISDVWPIALVSGWIYVSATLWSRNIKAGLRSLGVGMPLYLFGGGGIVHGDPWLVNTIKDIAQRARPSSVLHFTYSFPSGHTTASTFMAGYLAFALLPPLIDSLRADKAKARDEAAGKSGAVSTELDTKKRTLSNKLMIMWAGAVLMTASGRMLADVHWFSDTLGGACLGMFLVSLGKPSLNCPPLRFPCPWLASAI